MPLSDYQSFYNKAMTSLRPGMDAETANYKAALADQGILSSTGGQGAIQMARQKYLGAANQTAMDESYRQQGMAENQRQFGASSAMKVWEMLNAKALAQKQLDSKSKPWFPGQTAMFGDLAKNRYIAPTYSPNGPKGDPKEQQWPMRQEMNGNTDAGRTLDAQKADNAAMRAIQMAQLKLQQDAARRAAAAEDDANDPWAQITAMAFQNASTDINPDDAANPASLGFQAQAFPTQLMSAAQGTYGIDVMGEARKGNEKAVAVVKLMYPKTWMQKLGLEDGADAPLATPNSAALLRSHVAPYAPATGLPWADNGNKFPTGGGEIMTTFNPQNSQPIQTVWEKFLNQWKPAAI